MGERAPAAVAGSGQPLVVGVFEDQVRAEQAVGALEVWRRANRAAGVGPIGVVARRVSGVVTWRARGVTRLRRGALVGLVVGLVLFALPAAGAAALAAWVLGSVVLGLAGLVGAVPAGDVGGLMLVGMLASAALAAFLVGLVGAVIGCLVGLLVGVIDQQVRGLRRSEVGLAAAALTPGAWAAVARVRPVVEPLVRDELTRLGGAPTVLHEPLPQAPAVAASRER
jgi:hypothetical protein